MPEVAAQARLLGVQGRSPYFDPCHFPLAQADFVASDWASDLAFGWTFDWASDLTFD